MITISVVIPTYNRRASIAAAIDSALDQGVDGLEVLVVDDGSTDGTTAWVAQAYAGKPVQVLSNCGAKGPAGGRNTGMAQARGAFVALLDSDDAFLPGHISSALAVFERNPEVGAVFGKARYERNGIEVDYMGPNFQRKLARAAQVHADSDVVVFSDSFFSHLLEDGCWFNLSTVVLRKEVAGLRMNESLRISEDYEFWVRIARRWRWACLLKPQIRYTLHETNISFEAAGSASEHAPRLMQALKVIHAYPELSPVDLRHIETQMAGVLFDWAYRCGQGRHWQEAARLHIQSLRYGRRMENVLALMKLPVLSTLR